MTTTAAHPTLGIHTAVMQATGPNGLADLARPLTPTEQADLDAFLTRTAHMTDQQYAAELGVPADMAADIRALLGADL